MSNGNRKSLGSQVTTVKQANTALLLCLFFGWAGVHRVYAKLWWSALLYFFSFGLFFFGWAWDLVVIIRRRSALKREEVRYFDIEPEPDAEERGRRAEEDAAQRAALQDQNRAFLEANGIDVEMFDAEKVLTDVIRTIETTCPCMLRFDRGLSREMPTITFSSPTKTGKLPKNIVEARVSHEVVRMVKDSFGYEWPRYGDRIGATISYLSDGRINKLDVFGNHRGKTVDVSIRRQGDALLITSAGTHNANGTWQSLCPNADPSTGELLEALTREVERIY